MASLKLLLIYLIKKDDALEQCYWHRMGLLMFQILLKFYQYISSQIGLYQVFWTVIFWHILDPL